MPSAILDDGFLTLKNTFAAEEESESFTKIDEYSIKNTEDFIKLSQMNAGAYQNATINIAPQDTLLDLTTSITLTSDVDLGSGETLKSGQELSFKGLGSEKYPFKGEIKYSGTVTGYITLNTSLFNCLDQSAKVGELNLCSDTTSDSPDFALLAANFVNSPYTADDNNSSSTISLKISAYTDSDTKTTSTFGGIIGVMEKGSSLILSIDTLSQNDKFTGSGDIGMFCNEMDVNTSLTISSYKVNSTAVDALYFDVTTTGSDKSAGVFVGSMSDCASLTINSEYVYKGTVTGKANAGGVVGTMGIGASVNFVYGYTLSGLITSSANAGGIAGSATNPFITFDSDSSSNKFNLSSDAKISGGNSSGTAGGIIGDCIYTSDKTINISDYTFNSFTITNGKYAGGLYGSLSNTSSNEIIPTITIRDSNYSNSNGACSVYSSQNNYGGLIGKYSANNLESTLKIESVKTSSTLNSDCSSYSGLIAEVGNSSYVEIDDANINISNSKSVIFYGGVVAKAGSGIFINIGNVKVNGNYTAASASGGLVGYSTSGVIRLHGKTDLSASKPTGTTYRTGQLIGIRNDTLVYAVGDGSTLNSTAEEYSNSNKNNNDWYFNRCSKVYVSDIGDWGEVIRLNGSDLYETDNGNDKYALLYKNNHVVKLMGFISDDGYIKNLTEFAAYALSFQIDESDTFKKTKAVSSTCLIYLDTDTIDLSGTGLTGFTRDNVISNNDGNENKAKFKGLFTISASINNTTIRLAAGEVYGCRNETTISSADAPEGSGQIYDHSYLGLFGQKTENIVSSCQVKNITVSGSINFGLVANGQKVYAGAVAGYQPYGSYQTYSNVTVNTEINYNGDGSGSMPNAYVGGFVGYGRYSSTIKINDSQFSGSIINNATCSNFYNAGLIAFVENSGSQTISVENTVISGNLKVENSSSGTGAPVGGILASTGSDMGKTTITLTNINLYNFNININNKLTSTSGGFLGYNWRNCDVTLKGIRIQNSTLSTSALFGGLVYQASGKWNVEVYTNSTVGSTNVDVYTKAGVEFGENVTISGKSDSTNPSALMVARGDDYASNNEALYMNIASSDAYKINSGLTLNLLSSGNSDYFDEIVGRTITTVSTTDADGVTNVTNSENDNGIVSISTIDSNDTGEELINQNSCNTYSNVLTKSDSSNYINPNTRYYYNLNKFVIDNGNVDLEITSGIEMLLWSVGQYAADNLYTNFIDKSARGKDVKISGDYITLTGLSYYPISYAGHAINIKDATITFDYDQIQKLEKQEANKVLQYDSNGATQHYMMQSGLFLDVYSTTSASASVSLDNVILKGSIGRIKLLSTTIKNGTTSVTEEDASGAIICGNSYGVLSGTSYKTFSFTVNGLTLDEIKVDGVSDSYAPLLLNKAGSYSSLSISDVSVSSYTTTSNTTKAASSLIGDVGSENDVNISILFEDMDLSGRTDSSIFTRATFLNSFSYSIEDVASSGSYNFEEADLKITYGKEISNGVNDIGKTGRNPYTRDSGEESGQIWYYGAEKKVVEDSTNSVVANDGDGFFTVDYLRYVYVPEGGDNGTVAYKHELDINQTVVDIESGCGTYDDPYIINTDGQLETLAAFLASGSISNWNIKICYDQASKFGTDGKSIDGEDLSLATDGGNSYQFKSGSTWKATDTDGNEVTLTSDQVRAYLRNAYYMVTDDIILSSSFYGLGGSDPQKNTFSGVIVGKLKEDDSYPTIKISSHTNTSQYYFGGLIAYSNGSVVKNLNIDYSSTEISLASKLPSQARENQSFFGGVIGYVVGGDNIIDNVNVLGLKTLTLNISDVDVSDSLIYDSATTNTSKLTAVGGYVGLVGGNTQSGGGVIFRNILPSNTGFSRYNVEVVKNEEESTEDSTSTAAENPTKDNSTENDTTSIGVNNDDDDSIADNDTISVDTNNDDSITDNSTTDNEAGNSVYAEDYYWNPFVGRVLDGYAMAEDCTLENTDKNYKIPTIDTSNTISVTNSGSSVYTITISSEQQLWLLSAIVNSGAGGKATSANSYNTDAYNYGCVRTGNYNYVGKKITDDVKLDSSYIADVYDCNYLSGIQYSDNNPLKLSYLIKKYTTNDTNYVLSNVSTSEAYGYTITFDGDLNMSGYGNGFRGIGSGYTNNETSGELQKRSIYLSGTVGGNSSTAVTITIDRNVYEYSFEELQRDENGGGGWWTQSIGLFPALNFKGNTTFQYITLEGNVKINYTGDSDYIGETSAGGLAGVTVNGTYSATVKFDNLNTYNLTVSGAKFAGGLVGDFGQGSRTTKKILDKEGNTIKDGQGKITTFGTKLSTLTINNCNYTNLNVTGGYTAGGYIGVYISNATNINGSNTESTTFKNSHIKWNNDACYEVFYQLARTNSNDSNDYKKNGYSGGGGLFGYYNGGNLNINSSTKSSQKLTFNEVEISGPQFAYNCDYGLGLISGLQHSGTLNAYYVEADYCKVYVDIDINWNKNNKLGLMNATSTYLTPAAGIFVGYSNAQLNYNYCNIYNCELKNSGMIGCYGGSIRSDVSLSINNCEINETLIYSIGTLCYNGTSQVGGLCGGTKGAINISGVTMINDYIISDGKTGLIMGFANSKTSLKVENVYAKGCKVATTRDSTAKIILGDGTDPYYRAKITTSEGTDKAAGSAAILIGSVVDNSGASSMNNASLKDGSVFNMIVKDSVVGYYCNNSTNPLYWDTPTETIKNQATADYIGVYTGTNTGTTYTALYSADNTLSNVKGYTDGNFGKLIGSASGITKLYAIGISIQGKYYPYYENGYEASNVGINSGANSYIIYADYLGKSDADKTKTNYSGTINSNYTEKTIAVNSPYVVVNPFNDFIVYKSASDANNKTNDIYLTGDGFSNTAIEAIINDIANSGTAHTANLKYNQVQKIAESFTGTGDYASYLTYYFTASESDASNYDSSVEGLLKNFKVLLIEETDSDKITAMIKAYISLLTNSDQTSTAYYSGITVQTYGWNDTYNSFIALTNSNSLLYSNGTFSLNGAKHDNQLKQFTLIDVKYQNQKSTSQYYHLYIPVVVKKVLQYDFSVMMNNGSSTYDGDYSNTTSVLASYGENFTAKLSYNYTWTKAEWEAYLTSGNSLLWSYDKQVQLDAATTSSDLNKETTRITVVDINRYGTGDTYFTTDGSNLDTNPNTQSISLLNFSVLKDSALNSFSSVLICDLLSLKADPDNTNGTFKIIECADKTSNDLATKYPGATIRIWDNDSSEFVYYGPKTSSDPDDTKYFNISLDVDNTINSDTNITFSEVYYLIINCKDGDDVYSRVIQLGEDRLSSTDTNAIPTRKLSDKDKDDDRLESKYYTLGNFFSLSDNVMTTSSENGTNVIANGTNDYIDLETSVMLSVDDDYSDTFSAYAEDKKAYFRFAISLTDGSVTTAINANEISLDSLLVGEKDILDTGKLVDDSELEANSDSICYSLDVINGICYVTIAGLTANDYQNQTVFAKVRFDYEDALDKISEQFPERLNQNSTDGVAFSVVASIAYSKNSLDGTNMSIGPISDNKYYYREKIELVELTYDSYNTVSVDGNTSQLGINGREVESDKGQTITSLGSFNAKNLTSLELTDNQSERYPSKIVYKLTLEKKVDGDSGSEYKQVDISDYINRIVASYEEQSMDGIEEKDATTEIKASTFSFKLSENTIKNLSSDEIEVNISFFVKSDFSEAELEDLGDDVYSNYRIKLSAYLVNGNGTRITDEVSDYFVYTNAKFYLGIIGVNDFDASSDTN
jgi:hypothetical protein